MTDEMRLELERVKKMLVDGSHTCVIARGEDVYVSEERGVKPLLSLVESGKRLSGYVSADKVVGRAAAFLYVLLGVSCVHACVISEHAVAVLEEHGVITTYDQRVSAIRNRTNTGFCPMEQATLHARTPEHALACIKQALAELARQ